MTTLHQRTLPVEQSTVTRLKNNAFFYKRQLRQFTFHPLLQNPLLFMMVATSLASTVLLLQFLWSHRGGLPDPVFVYPLFLDPQSQFISLRWINYLVILKSIPALTAIGIGYWLAQKEQTYFSNFICICITVADVLFSLVLITYLKHVTV